MKNLSIVLLLSMVGFSIEPSFAIDRSDAPNGVQTYLFDHPNRVEGQYLVKLKPSLIRSLKSVTTANIKKIALVNGLYSADETSLQELLQNESKNSIDYIEAAVRFQGIVTTSKVTKRIDNEPAYENQWGLWDKVGGVFADSAWTVSKGTKKTTAAIIDSGIRLDHPDLTSNIWRNPGEYGTDENGRSKSRNGIDDDANGLVDDIYGWDFAGQDNIPNDENGHGSHVAGVIGADARNGVGIVGINHDISLMALKTFDADGFSDTKANIEAIAYAAENGADVINASWGGGPYSQAMVDTISAATAKGSTFVAASGNSGINVDEEPVYPCDFPIQSLICVGASTRDNTRVSFSNYGKLSVDIAAPGEGILSTFLEPDYEELDGTSMAAPFVSGAVALLRSYNPSLRPSKIKEAILVSGTKLSDGQNDFVSGKRLNISGALKHVGGNPTGTGTPPDPKPILPTVDGFLVRSVGDEALMVEFTPPQGLDLDLISGYIASVSSTPLQTEETWKKAIKYFIAKPDSGFKIRHFLTGLIPNSKGFMSIRVAAKDKRLGPFGQAIPYSFNGKAAVFDFNGSDQSVFLDRTEGWESTGGTDLKGPLIHSGNSQSIEYLELPAIDLKNTKTLDIEIKMDRSYRDGFDAGYLESKYDNFGWAPEETYLGTKKLNSTLHVLNVPKHMRAGKIKLRLKSMLQSRDKSRFTKISRIRLFKN